MQHDSITLSELEQHLIDLNQLSRIPSPVIDFFSKWKEKQGTIATGIAYIPSKGWYIFSPALQGDIIIKHFSDDIK